MEYNIITRGQILKRMRTSLGLKQEELSGADITRNLISMIENDKAALTDKAAKVIYNNLERVIEEKGIYTQIDINEIFVKEEDQVAQICDDFINKIDKSMNIYMNEIDNIITLLNRYNMNRYKMKLYAAIARKARRKNQNSEAFRNYIMALEFGMNVNGFDDECLNILLDFAEVPVRKSEKQEIIKAFDYFINNVSWETNGECKFKAIVRKSQILFEIKEYGSMLRTLEQIKVDKISYVGEQYLSIIKLMKARCNYKLGIFNKSARVYEEILKRYENEKDENSQKIIVEAKVHIADIKEKFGEDFSQNISEAYEELSKISSYEEFQIGIDLNRILGKLFYTIRQEDKAFKCYEEALRISNEMHDYDSLEGIMNHITDMILENYDEKYLELVESYISDIIEAKEEVGEVKSLLNIMKIYLLNNKNGKVENIIKKLA